MRFSVIIPLYNKEWAIARTLESVFAQTYVDFEVIVVDDGSTDRGAVVVEQFSDSRLKLLKQSNSGVSTARNNGVKKSQGEIICFLDGDDVWDKGHLAEIDRLANKYPKARFYTDRYEVCYRSRPNVVPEFPGLYDYDGIVVNYAYACSGQHNVVNSSTAAVDRDALLSMSSMFPEGVAIGEDLDLWLRLALRYPLAYSSRTGAYYDRDTGDNARTRNSVHCPTALFRSLEVALGNSSVPANWKPYLRQIYDRKMVAYVFSLINMGDRLKALDALVSWDPCVHYLPYKVCLQIARMLPTQVIEAVHRLRMRTY